MLVKMDYQSEYRGYTFTVTEDEGRWLVEFTVDGISYSRHVVSRQMGIITAHAMIDIHYQNGFWYGND